MVETVFIYVLNRLKKATSKDWKISEMPEEIDTFNLDKEVSMDEYKKLLLGLIPNAMEDKWFIYVENSEIYFHRSWTGNCIFSTTIEKFERKILLTITEVNRNQAQYKGTDLNADKTLLNHIIDRLLLNIRK